MSNRNDQDTKALTIISEDDLASIAEAGNDLTAGAMVGDPLKFVKGVWKKRNGDGWVTVSPVQQFVVDVLSYQRGWIRWHEKKPTHRYIGRHVDHFPFPVRSRLPEPELEGNQEDPWQETHQIVLRDLGAEGVLNANGKLYTYTTSSYNGPKAIGKLLKAFASHAKEHPGQMPVVYLGSFDKEDAKAVVACPLFTICDWTEFGDGASPPGRKLVSVPPIPQITDQSETKNDEDDVRQPKEHRKA